jgi:hypothetical protein
MITMGRRLIISLLSIISSHSLACSLVVTRVPGAAIRLKSTTSTVTRIATVVENCPDAKGYVVTISSKENSSMKSARAAYAYQVSYSHGPFVSLAVPYTKTYSGPSDMQPRTVDVLTPANRGPVAGNYLETLTISVSGR